MHSQVFGSGEYFPLLVTGPQGGKKGYIFATPPGHAAAEAPQVWLLRGAVVRSCLSAPDPGNPSESRVLPWQQLSIIQAAEDLSLKLFRWGLSGLMLNISFLYSS